MTIRTLKQKFFLTRSYTYCAYIIKLSHRCDNRNVRHSFPEYLQNIFKTLAVSITKAVTDKKKNTCIRKVFQIQVDQFRSSKSARPQTPQHHDLQQLTSPW